MVLIYLYLALSVGDWLRYFALEKAVIRSWGVADLQAISVHFRHVKTARPSGRMLLAYRCLRFQMLKAKSSPLSDDERHENRILEFLDIGSIVNAPARFQHYYATAIHWRDYVHKGLTSTLRNLMPEDCRKCRCAPLSLHRATKLNEVQLRLWAPCVPPPWPRNCRYGTDPSNPFPIFPLGTTSPFGRRTWPHCDTSLIPRSKGHFLSSCETTSQVNTPLLFSRSGSILAT